jgi:hypothetical protein
MLLASSMAQAQVDQARAASYFAEAAALCAREGGRLWGVSLCGPMVIADAQTRTMATNQPVPDAPRPQALGFANAAMPWGGTRWSTFVWQWLPADEQERGLMMIHELFHRVQPDLGLLLNEPQNDHLDMPAGRYWLQLEWRALERALRGSGEARSAALRDALAFRSARRKQFPEAAENERRLEINEGLAQYTGTVASTMSVAEATASAIEQLVRWPQNQTFVRTFAYPLGAAYGLLLDEAAPGWTHRLKPSDDLAALLIAANGLESAGDAEAAALRYGGAELRVSEERREAERQARVAEYRRRFVDGPVIIIPRGPSASFITNGITPIPGEGLIYPAYRTSGEWGSLEADLVLVSTDRLRLPAPANTQGPALHGDGWTLTLTPQWVVRPGARLGDFQVVRDSTRLQH